MNVSVQHCAYRDGFQFNIITKNDILGVFIQLIRWARCDLYYIFTVIDSYRQKKKKKTQHREWRGNGSHSSGSGTEDFPPVFRGLGREEIKVCDAFGNRR